MSFTLADIYMYMYIAQTSDMCPHYVKLAHEYIY